MMEHTVRGTTPSLEQKQKLPMGITVLRMVPGGILPVSGTSGRLCIPFEFGGMNTRVGTTTSIGE